VSVKIDTPSILRQPTIPSSQQRSTRRGFVQVGGALFVSLACQQRSPPVLREAQWPAATSSILHCSLRGLKILRDNTI